MPTPQPRPHRGRPPGAPAEPPGESRVAALRWVRRFGLLLLAGLAVGAFTLPWPWPLLSGVLCMAALAVGIVALVKVRGARIRGALTGVVTLGLVVAGMLGIASLGQVVLWREYSAYSSCVRAALTAQARDACDARLQHSLDERVRQMEQLMRQAS
ncbi:hypothetical protein [Georgenia thermotolerans]|uniref:hypothetical protein n=1 Tax=Georgenia thermotolerans TaxID=527326 RepID=UPI0014788A58|nr:hypothetical protein [Georgenia thermotolerans]